MKIGKLRKQSRIKFVQKLMSPASGDFCLNIGEDDGINEHMGKYRDIICTIPEFKNLDVKSEIKDIEKVNDTNFLTDYNIALTS